MAWGNESATAEAGCLWMDDRVRLGIAAAAHGLRRRILHDVHEFCILHPGMR
jgi:hypothetical protein